MTGIADPYGLVLFVHLAALLGAISAGALAHHSEARLRTAETLLVAASAGATVGLRLRSKGARDD
jgi:hypothetical protein